MASQMFKRFISYVGKVKLTDLPEIWQKPVNEVLTAAENTNPIIKQAEIKYAVLAKKGRKLVLLTVTRRGAQPHKSYKDPSDPKDVISVRLLKESGSRVDTIHVHQDGTSKRK